MITWITPENLDQILANLRSRSELGFDTEFDSVDLSWQSPVGVSRLDVASFAWVSGPVNARGIPAVDSCVVSSEHLPLFRGILEDENIVKYVHNQPVDAHTLWNMGIELRGAVNTLSWARWVWPHRVNVRPGSFDLDALCRWQFGEGKTEDFGDIFVREEDEAYEEIQEASWCTECFDFGCRKRGTKKNPLAHLKVPKSRSVTKTKKVKRVIPLHEVRQGHPLFQRYLVYAAIDAELALKLAYRLDVEGSKEVEFPWPL